jgi:general stress protein YciG
MATNDKSKDDSMTTAQAGKMGGDKVLNERGREFYSEIGQQQGKENNPGNFANRPKEDVKAAASEGGKHSHRGDSNNTNNSDDADLDEAA